MPANVYITARQIAVLAETGEDVLVCEQRNIADVLDCWIMGADSHGDQHRSMILEQDGAVISDAVVPDPDHMVRPPDFSMGGDDGAEED